MNRSENTVLPQYSFQPGSNTYRDNVQPRSPQWDALQSQQWSTIQRIEAEHDEKKADYRVSMYSDDADGQTYDKNGSPPYFSSADSSPITTYKHHQYHLSQEDSGCLGNGTG